MQAAKKEIEMEEAAALARAARARRNERATRISVSGLINSMARSHGPFPFGPDGAR